MMKILGVFMYKVIICLLIICFCFALGVVFSNSIKRRKNFWFDITMLCDYMISNISFGQKKVKEIFSEFSASCKPECKGMLDNYIDINFLNTTKSFKAPENIDFTSLEQKTLEDFFNHIGEFDSLNEIEKIKNYKQTFNNFLQEYDSKNAKYSPLIIKLAIIFGLVIAIVLI